MLISSRKLQIPKPEDALPGRAQAMAVPSKHFVLGTPIQGDFQGKGKALFGMGCFWGAERVFWQTQGVYSTAVGYAGGYTPNPTYEEVCSGSTGHNEAVLVVFEPSKTTYQTLLNVFWEHHDPTQGMRQGNDAGTQYRSGIYTFDTQQQVQAEVSRERMGEALLEAGYGPITTEIVGAGDFYYAEEYHQQYLGKNPGGYCGLGGTGVTCPAGMGTRP